MVTKNKWMKKLASEKISHYIYPRHRTFQFSSRKTTFPLNQHIFLPAMQG